MAHRSGRHVVSVLGVGLLLFAAGPSAQRTPTPDDTLGTAGAAMPMPQRWAPPTGPAPRLPNGKPDFNGVWDHPYVPDMSTSRSAAQKGAGPLPYTSAGMENIKSYDPEKNGDYTGMCMPFGLMRSMNSPYPIQILQNDKYVAFLFEQNTWFHVVPFRDRHSAEPHPTWFGESIAKWDGDTLIIDTLGFNGYTRLDTRGNPHSTQLHLVQTFAHTDAGHLRYTVTVSDPVYYSKTWSNERTFTLTNGDLLEYSCEENNRSLWEGRIKLWIPPDSEPLRNPRLGN